MDYQPIKKGCLQKAIHTKSYSRTPTLNLPVSSDLAVLESLSLVGVSFNGMSATLPVGPLPTPLVAVAVVEEEGGVGSADTGGRFFEASTTCCGVIIGI